MTADEIGILSEDLSLRGVLHAAKDVDELRYWTGQVYEHLGMCIRFTSEKFDDGEEFVYLLNGCGRHMTYDEFISFLEGVSWCGRSLAL